MAEFVHCVAVGGAGHKSRSRVLASHGDILPVLLAAASGTANHIRARETRGGRQETGALADTLRNRRVCNTRSGAIDIIGPVFDLLVTGSSIGSHASTLSRESGRKEPLEEQGKGELDDDDR